MKKFYQINNRNIINLEEIVEAYYRGDTSKSIDIVFKNRENFRSYKVDSSSDFEKLCFALKIRDYSL